MPENKQWTDRAVLQVEGGGDATSLSLIERVKSQDEVAWMRLMRLYEPLVTRWCRRMNLQEADAADVAQEVFNAVWRKIGEFRRDPPQMTFRGWLRTITKRKIIDLRRRKEHAPAAEGGSDAQDKLSQLPADDTEDEASLSEEKAILFRRALLLLETEFPSETLQAFWLYAIEGLPAATVAEQLRTSTNVVYLARSRVLKRLRVEFKDLLDAHPPEAEGGETSEVLSR